MSEKPLMEKLNEKDRHPVSNIVGLFIDMLVERDREILELKAKLAEHESIFKSPLKQGDE